MPTYEYRCKGCGRQLEVVQAFTDAPLEECQECGGQLRKVFGSVGISFKGSGFYKNDSRSGTKSSSGASGSSGNGSSSSSSSSSETAATNGSSSSGNGASGDGKGSSEKSATGSKSSPAGSSS